MRISVLTTTTTLVSLVVQVAAYSQQLPGHLSGPPSSRAQVPGFLEESPIPDAVVIVNRGNQQIYIQYYNSSRWVPISILSGRSTTIRCIECGNSIYINFHDGVEARMTQVSNGRVYQIFWEGNRWALAPGT